MCARADQTRLLPYFPHSIAFSGRACHRSATAAGGAALEIAPPVACWDSSSCAFPPHGPARWARRCDGTRCYRWASPRRTACWGPWGCCNACSIPSCRSTAFCACSRTVLVTGLAGAARPTAPPAFFSWHPWRTRGPVAAPAVGAPCSAKRRHLGPQANTRRPCRGRARCRSVWNGARNAVRPGDALAVRFPGSVRRAGRRHGPRRTPGPRARLRLLGRSKPSLRRPGTRYDDSGGNGAR
jgi:hypothetical protein